MHKPIIFPDFIGETEIAMVMVIPSIKSDMANLFERFHAGEEVDYWFSWNLALTDEGDYLVALDIVWDTDDGIVIGFNEEMWEVLDAMVQKKNLLLMADWDLLEEGVESALDWQGEFKPYALLIREIQVGIEKLTDQVREIAALNNAVPLERLLFILQSLGAGPRPLH